MGSYLPGFLREIWAVVVGKAPDGSSRAGRLDLVASGLDAMLLCCSTGSIFGRGSQLTAGGRDSFLGRVWVEASHGTPSRGQVQENQEKDHTHCGPCGPSVFLARLRFAPSTSVVGSTLRMVGDVTVPTGDGGAKLSGFRCQLQLVGLEPLVGKSG